MRSFASLQSVLSLKRSHQADLWTTYFTHEHDYVRCEADWGPSHVYHFVRDVLLSDWLDLNTCLTNWIESQSKLNNVRVVPFYEIGSDFLVQCKPPCDGGYYTNMYAEFLNCGSCEPAPWFYRQLASLHENVAGCMNTLGHPDSNPESRIVHASLIMPNDQLFWTDEDGWDLYYANIRIEDIRQPNGG